MKGTGTEFSELLLSWYASHKRELPWRGIKNPYYVWLSEVILQQTRIVQGLPYYLSFVENFPTIKDLAEAPEEKVLKLWQGLGYYSRAKNLHLAAKYILDELGGNFPTTYQEIIKLKGVGDYTASTIASICFDEPKASVDGNVYRVLSRIFGIEIPINTTQGVKYFKELALALLDKKRAGEYNQALMDFGAIQCKPQAPNCQECIMNTKCLAYTENKVTILPIKLPKIKIKQRYFHYCILIDSDNQTIINKRTEKDIWQGLYEFPLLEFKKAIDDKQVMEIICDRYPNVIKLEKHIKTSVHKLTHQHIYATFWIIYIDEKINNSLPISEVEKYPLPILIAKFLKNIIP